MYIYKKAKYVHLYIYVHIYHTWKKVGTQATGCRRQGPKNDAKMPKPTQKQRNKTTQKIASKFWMPSFLDYFFQVGYLYYVNIV